MTLKIYCLFSLLLVSTAAQAQTSDTIRIMTWNLTELTAETAPQRISHYARVLNRSRPHILVTQGNIDHFLETRFIHALPGGSNRWQMIYDNGPDSDPVCYIDPGKVAILSKYYIATDLRNIAEYRLAVLNSRDTFRLFTCDLPQGADSATRALRTRALSTLRRRMDTIVLDARRSGTGDSLFVVAGTFNVVSQRELGYLIFTGAEGYSAGSRMYDQRGMPGDWGWNPEFASLHTFPTRPHLSETPPVHGLVYRYDQITVSSAMSLHFVPGSYVTYGNDGRHFNDSINRLPNLAVADSIAESLHAASDHLPVYADFAFERTSSAVRERPASRIAETAPYPQPATDRITLPVQWAYPGSMRVRLIDSDGETVLDRTVTITVGQRTLELDVSSLPAGVYGYSAETSAIHGQGKVVVVR